MLEISAILLSLMVSSGDKKNISVRGECAKCVQNLFFFKTCQFLVLLKKIRYVLIADKGSERNPDVKEEILNFS